MIAAVAEPARSLQRRIAVRYNAETVKPLLSTLVILLVSGVALGQNSFRVHVPDAKGKEAKAVLTFNDNDKMLQVNPAKREPISIPYSEIDGASYEYTNERTIAMTHEKMHWLEIQYHNGDAHKKLLLRMDGHDAPRIQVAFKAHTGIEPEILGNADKRHGKF
jgi:hypothetical protein